MHQTDTLLFRFDRHLDREVVLRTGRRFDPNVVCRQILLGLGQTRERAERDECQQPYEAKKRFHDGAILYSMKAKRRWPIMAPKPYRSSPKSPDARDRGADRRQ